MPPENDPVFNAFVLGTMLLSALTVLALGSMRRRGPLLPFEPRQPVPWGAAGALLAVMYLVLTFFSAAGNDDSKEPMQPLMLMVFLLQQVFIVGGFLFVIALLSNATKRDLGLPANVRQFARDVFVGIVACLAALAPVRIVQVAMIYLLFPDQVSSGHPLVKMLTSAPPSTAVFVCSTIAAVVVAPICEEITFRLLLQGWLEKWEDRRQGWRDEPIEELMTTDDARTTNDESNPLDDSSFVIRHSTFADSPPQKGIAGLPHGSFPIIISAIFFALAHLGYGPEPVPLFFLALVLGYVYQRTHRIVPCIVTHALFNAFTMIMLWRITTHPG